jgi:dTDP-4-dehydrorhamnose 3,5-epimerase
MKIEPSFIAGVFHVTLDRIEDDRGFFARSWCAREAKARGLDPLCAQSNVSFNRRKSTLRGLHLQRAPHAENKLVRCTRGAIGDVVLDLRPASATFRRWELVELTEDNRRAIYIPGGCAHGFQTLRDDSEVFYQMSEFYMPDFAAGVRWNDPAFAIAWPLGDPILSPRDAAYPDFSG